MNISEEALTAAQDAYWEGMEEACARGVQSLFHHLGMKAALSAADHLKNIRARHEAMEQAALVRRPSHVDRGRLLDALERVLGECDQMATGSDTEAFCAERVRDAINDALEGK